MLAAATSRQLRGFTISVFRVCGHDRLTIAPMSSQVSAEKLGDAILQSVEHGGFPQDEHVASAAVPSSALPKLLEVVGRAREETKVRVTGHTLGLPAND
jgi:hypothetical protein